MVTLAPARPRTRPIPWDVAVGLVLAVLVMVPLTRGPHFVPRITIENPTPYTLAVTATDGRHRDWTAVAIVTPKSTTSVRDVVDQGDTWVFRAAGQGADGGEYRATRRDLQRAGWRLTIPNDVAVRLRAAGAPSDPGF
jgi:hypothetical protein